MSSERAGQPGIRRGLLTAARVLVAILLGKGALAFLLYGRSVFAHLGRPDEVRVAIVGIELLGAALFLWKRTAVAGGVVLSLLLAWVAGFHYAVGWGSTWLFVFLAAVFALTLLTIRGKALPAESGSVR
jgi:hypothetical protein